MSLDTAPRPLGNAPRGAARPPSDLCNSMVCGMTAASEGWWHRRPVISVLLGLGYHVVANAQSALAQRGIETGFGFLLQKAGFAISESPIPFAASDTYLRAYGVGILNTLKVSFAAIILASILGLMIGIAVCRRT